MAGAGVLTLLAMLLLAPLELWVAHAEKRRFLSPHELNLRRASQPLGGAAVLLFGVWLFGARSVGHALTALAPHLADNRLVAVLLGAVLLYGLASFITGARRCWGVRSDGMLPVWAFFKLALGIGGLVLLRRDTVAGALGSDWWATPLWQALNAAAVWCAVVGATRFVLLTVGGGNALGVIEKQLNRRNAPLRAARRRPWWRFW